MPVNLNLKVVACFALATLSFNSYAQKPNSTALNDLIKSENAFAKAAADQNIKKAFLLNLDTAGLIFSGAKTYNGLKVYANIAENNDQLLAWYPAVAQVASSGDVGFTSGPFTYSDKRTEAPSGHGYYFTIWKKDAAGNFKVMLDGGVEHSLNKQPGFKQEAKLESAADIKSKLPAAANHSGIDFRQAETSFNNMAATDPSKAYQTFLNDKAWMLRTNQLAHQDKPGDMEMITKELVKAYYFTEGGYGVSIDKGLVYTYGAVSVSLAGKDVKPAGFYIRVWQFDGKQWKIIADEVSY